MTRAEWLLGAALLAAGSGALYSGAVLARKQPMSAGSYAPGVCRAIDGDTLRCGDERVRLVEIDAPEMPGHCRKGRVCAPGNPVLSKQALQAQLQRGAVELRRYAYDRYGRTVADARVRGASLSCLQIRGGMAMRQLKWADYGVTRAECP